MRRRNLAVGFVVAALAALFVPAVADAAGTASIEGTVSEGGVVPIQKSGVCALPVAGGTYNCTTTNALGQYTLSGLSAGTYAVEFNGGEECTEQTFEGETYVECKKHPYVPQYWNDKSSFRLAEHIVLSEGHKESSVNASLIMGGKIEGTVTEAGTAKAIAGMLVCAGSETVEAGNCANTGPSGEYVLEGLPTATNYAVEFTGFVCNAGCAKPYVSQVRQPVSVTAPNATTGIDASMQPGGKIEGTVTTASIAKAPIAGLTVCAFSASARSGGCGQTNAKGEYTIEGLATASDYKVEFEGEICTVTGGKFECSRPYLTQYYNGKSHEAEADSVSVTAPNATTGIDASMLESKPVAPTSAAAPVLSGTAAVGQTLSCSQGSWAGNPTSLSYSWLRGETVISGQAGSTYTVQAADQGQTISCVVTASNAAGAAAAKSNGLAVPSPPPPPPPAPPKRGTAVANGVARVQGGAALVALNCSGGGACEGSFNLVYEKRIEKVVKHHGHKHVEHIVKKMTIGEAHFSIQANGHLTVAATLTAEGRKLVSKAGKGGLKARLSGSDIVSRTLVIKSAQKGKAKAGHGH
jgi:hypothetical protein